MRVKNGWVIPSPVLIEENSDLYLGVVHAFPLLYRDGNKNKAQGYIWRIRLMATHCFSLGASNKSVSLGDFSKH